MSINGLCFGVQCVEHRNPVTGRQSPAYVIGELNGQGDYSTMDQAEEEKGFSFAPPAGPRFGVRRNDGPKS